jgi:hypothetical protein
LISGKWSGPNWIRIRISQVVFCGDQPSGSKQYGKSLKMNAIHRLRKPPLVKEWMSQWVSQWNCITTQPPREHVSTHTWGKEGTTPWRYRTRAAPAGIDLRPESLPLCRSLLILLIPYRSGSNLYIMAALHLSKDFIGPSWNVCVCV